MLDETRVARPSRSTPTSVPRPAYFILTYAPEERVLPGHRFLLHPAETTIGRDSDNSIALVDSDTVSRHHCRITAGVGSFELLDQRSTNGTYVNEQEISKHTLRHGDYIRLGRAIFRYLAGEGAERDYYEEVHQLAIAEPRTHLANYRRLREALVAELARFNQHGGSLSLVLISIDQLAATFQEHGPVASDHIIRGVADRLRPFARAQDVLAAPYPSGEFALLIPEPASVAVEIAEDLRAAVTAAPLQWGSVTLKITASVGVVQAEPGMNDPNAMLQAAGTPTRESIESGGNRVSLLDSTATSRPLR